MSTPRVENLVPRQQRPGDQEEGSYQRDELVIERVLRERNVLKGRVSALPPQRLLQTEIDPLLPIGQRHP